MLPFTLRLLTAIACLSLAGFASTSGQTTPAPAATNAPATNAPAATPPVTPIALGDVVAQAQSIMAKLRDDQASLAVDQITQLVEENLPVVTRDIEEREAEDKRLLGSNPSLSNLQNSQAAWRALATNLAASEKTLSDRANRVNTQLSRLNQQSRNWQATVNSTNKTAPPEITQQIKAVLAAIAETTKAAQAAQSQILSVQGRIAAQSGRINDDLDVIAKAMETARAQLFEQDHPQLWKAEAISSAGTGIVAQETVSFDAQLDVLKAYLKDRMPAVLVHLLIFVLLIIGFYWIRNAVKLQAAKEAALHHAARVFDVPVATALLLALLFTGFLYPSPPLLLLAIVGAIALIPAVVIIRRLLEPVLFPILYATVAAYLFDQLRYVVTPTGVLARFLFIFELLAASIFLLLVLRAKHLAASVQQSDRLKRMARLYLHVAFVVFVFAGLANAFGYVDLSILVGKGMLESSYLAVILYAAVRILDALVIAAMNIRPLTRLRMVRLHQELLYQNVTTFIQWLAVALWFVAALELFSLRDPAWQEIQRLLWSEHKWFNLPFTFGTLLALPITIWASFLLSRLIRFVLEEEVYPNLPLGRGIPYAASTMVHYTVLVLGFFVALSAANIDLSKFTILAGAFGVGLGFGLQNIMNNFMSGIILLFERPIKVGDTIQMDANTMGRVERIGIRASVILLTNGAELIVPNGNLISNPVTNWTLSNTERLIEIPVSVTSKADPQHVLQLLIDVAHAHRSVIKNPPPEALLITIAGTTLTFRLRAWIDAEDQWMKVTSELSLAINSALAKENIALG